MINKVILIGNLGADPEIRALESGAKVARLSVATNENYQDKNGEWQKLTEWHNVVAWRGLAERSEYLKKGGLVYVEGKLTTRKWTDKDGNDKYTTEVVARLLRSLERRESTGVTGPGFSSAPDEFPKSKIETNSNSSSPAKSFDVPDDDDLPF